MNDYYTDKDKLTEKDIILSHIKKLSELSVLEWRGGYMDFKDLGNRIVEVYVPDSRKQFIQGVEVLEILLYPYLKKQSKDKYGHIQKEITDNLKQLKEKKISDDDYVTNKLNLSLELLRMILDLLREIGWFEKKGRAG